MMTSDKLTVRELVNRQSYGGMFYVTPELTIRQVAGALQSHGISAIAVMTTGNDAPDRLVGIISEKDITHSVLCGDDPNLTTAADIMAINLITVDINASLWVTAKYMLDNKIRHLPVMEDDVPRSMLSIRDVLAVLVEAFGTEIENLRADANWIGFMSGG